MTVVERDDDERKDLCLGRGRQTGCGRTDGRIQMRGSLCPFLFHTRGLYYFIYFAMFLSLSLWLSVSLAWTWQGSFVVVVEWTVNGHGLGGWLAFVAFWCLRGGMGGWMYVMWQSNKQAKKQSSLLKATNILSPCLLFCCLWRRLLFSLLSGE